jgi:hypothetical protein
MIGLGLTIGNLAVMQSGRLNLQSGSSLPFISHADAWNGTAGSGFTTVPTDPVRTTAKPILRLITVPNQRFTDRMVVGVQAFANANGTLIGGIDRVRFHYEGRSMDVLQPGFRSFNDANGQLRRYWGYWIELRRGADDGAANLYVEAIPADATMQRRVIGPYRYFPAATPYAVELQVAATPPEIAGQRYKTFAAAREYLRLNNVNSARITFTESATIEPTSIATTYSPTSWITVTHAPGVTVTFGKLAFSAAGGQMRLRTNMLHFKGNGIYFDWRNMTEFRMETGQTFWFDGVKSGNSDPAGPQALWAKGPRPMAYLFSQASYYTEVYCDWGWVTFGNAILVRCALVEAAVNDFGGNGQAITHCTVRNGNTTSWWNERAGAAMTITYDPGPGLGSAATVEVPGGANQDRVFTFRVDGVVVGSFTMLNNFIEYLGAQYNVSDLVNYINGPLKAIDPGFSATLLDDSRKGAWLGLKSGNGKGFTAQPLTNTTLSLFCEFDLHTDFLVLADGGSAENIIWSFNRVRNWGGQCVWLGGNAGDRGDDIAIVGNIFDSVGGYLSHVRQRIMTHVVIAHNTWTDQVFAMRTTATWGAYSLIANNVAPGMSGDTAGYLVTVRGNHVEIAGAELFSGSRITGGVNDTVGGTAATNFTNALAGDYAAAGPLLANLKTPVMVLDNGVAPGVASAAGAVLPPPEGGPG